MKSTFSTRIFKYILPWMAVLFLLASWLFFYYQARVFIREKTDDMELIMADRAEDFNERFREIKAELAYVGRFPSVRRALKSYENMSVVEQYQTANQISEDMNGINIFNNYIEDIIIIGTNGFYKNLDAYESLRSEADPLAWDSIRQYEPGDSYFYFTQPYEADYYADEPHRVFSAVLPIRENGQVIGYIQGNLNYEKVTGMLKSSLRGRREEEAVFGAITREGDAVFIGDETSSNSMLPDGEAESNLSAGEESGNGTGDAGESRRGQDIAPEDDRIAVIYANATSESGSFEIRKPERKLVIYRKLSATGWIFFAEISYKIILQTLQREALVLLCLVLPCSVLIMSFAIMLLARQIQKPMERLKNRVEHVDIENYEPDGAAYEIREVQIVADRFEESMERNKRLIRHVFEEELLRKDAELEVLRNQITPHFIYNSLQLIKAEAVMAGSREVGRSVNALAGLLRYSMDSRTDVVMLREELVYIDHYLEIYKKRYVDRFDYEIVTDESLGDLRIPKMILQPLVENSIRHGFAETRHGGEIRICVESSGDFLKVRIEDNGSGATEERLAELRRGLADPEEHAGREIGLLNVHRRIRLQCGEESGVTEIGNLPEGGFWQQLKIKPISS